MSRFVEDLKKRKRDFLFLSELRFGSQPQESSPTFDKVSEVKSLVAQA